MLSVYSALSGELLTVVDDFEGKTAKERTYCGSDGLYQISAEVSVGRRVLGEPNPQRFGWCYWSGAHLTLKTEF